MVRFAAMLLFAAATACGGQAASDGSDASPVDGGGECHSLVNSAQPVPNMQVASSPPTAQGGPIVDGRYHRVANAIYTGTGGATGPYGQPVAETLSFRSGDLRVVFSGPLIDERVLMSYTTDGSAINLLFECPPGGRPPIDTYTASADRIVLLGDVSGTAVGTEYELVEAW